MSYKPATYSDLSPYLIVRDIDAALAFVEAAFGATRLRYHRHADGTPQHAEARIGDSVVMMGQSEAGPAAHVHLYVPDVRHTFAAAIADGGTALQEPTDQGDGDLRAGVTDPTGTTWWPSTQMVPSDPTENKG